MPKISIIMPTYNAEKTIIRAVKSVLNQNFNDYELIIINDESTDNTSKIVSELFESEKKVIFKTIKNSGVSVARNTGIREAKGEFVTFLDSDDYYEKDALEIMNSNLNDNIELLIYGHNIVDRNEKTIKRSVPDKQLFFDKQKFRGYVLELIKNERLNAPWNKVYKRELILSNSINFPEDINIAEDLIFNLDYIKKITSIRIIDYSLINYVVIKNQGLVSNFRENRLDIRLRVYRKCVSLFQYWEINNSNVITEMNSIVVKDTFAYFMDFSKDKCLFSRKEKIEKIYDVLSFTEVKDAINYRQKYNLSVEILRIILDTKNPYLILSISKLFHKIKRR